MTPRLLRKDGLAGFLAGKVEVLAPVRVPGEEASRYGPVKSAQDVCLDYLNTRLPVKELFFPQREVLFRFRPGRLAEAEPVPEPPERVVFGVRPCDAAALELFDRVFLDPKYDDPGYRRRREQTTLVGLACDKPGEACFCTAVGGDPHGTAALDLLLEDIGDSWLCRPLTGKGEKLVEGLKEAAAGDVADADKHAEAARAALQFALDRAGLENKLAGAFEHDVWEELARPCVNCGVCTFVCPTCHCFDVTDEERADRGARIRTWDSCQFALFTRHASGHNPRPTGRDRLRNRTLHKFRFFPTTHGSVLCVGCGRCITDCPAGIDLRETLETLDEALE